MLNDITLWKWDSPRLKRRCEASLILVSDQFKEDDVYYRDMLQRMGNRGYFVVLVTPTLDINKPESPEWPGLLIDEGPYVFDKVVTQHESAEEDLTPTEEELPMDYDPFGDQASSDSSENEEGRQFWKPPTDEEVSKLIPSPEEPPLYRWIPILSCTN
ncbi:hypothetical protein Rs2_06140 [Raphanus sativus]|nr:hypothetical protein Rs2_06140 [Raphanus sativus]